MGELNHWLFDAQPPAGWTLVDYLRGELPPEIAHLSVGEPPRGFESFLLDLADISPGFRVLVADPLIVSIMSVACKGFREEDRINTSSKTTRVGTWRGYPVYTAEGLGSGDSALGYFAESPSAPAISSISVVNWR